MVLLVLSSRPAPALACHCQEAFSFGSWGLTIGSAQEPAPQNAKLIFVGGKFSEDVWLVSPTGERRAIVWTWVPSNPAVRVGGPLEPLPPGSRWGLGVDYTEEFRPYLDQLTEAERAWAWQAPERYLEVGPTPDLTPPKLEIGDRATWVVMPRERRTCSLPGPRVSVDLVSADPDIVLVEAWRRTGGVGGTWEVWPLLIEPAGIGATLTMGEGHLCGPRIGEIPTGTPVTVVLRPLDGAGNYGTPVMVELLWTGDPATSTVRTLGSGSFLPP